MTEDISRKNIESFSSTNSVEAYSNDYLRESERYVIDTYGTRGKRVLDLGCGTGRTTSYIYKNGADVVGIDPAEGMITRGRELHPELDLRVGDARHLDFPDNYFDLVFFSFNGLDNLYPISERQNAVREIKRVLKTGGIFAYSSHNSLALPRTARGLRDWFLNLPHFHLGPHYRIERHDFGKLIQYYNNVWNEERWITSEGFKLEKRIGGPFSERFPMYICRKPQLGGLASKLL
ncbi:MAG: class I SAM-dependent methyltransferase [Patescibacteria group bacterium]